MIRRTSVIALAIALTVSPLSALGPVVTPGSPAGAIGLTGGGVRSIGCQKSKAGDECMGGSQGSRLRAATLSRPDLGPRSFYSRVRRSDGFSVAADAGGRQTALPARICAKAEVKGFLAALLEGRAAAVVELRAVDLESGAVVGSHTLFRREAAGKFTPSLGVSAGVLLPIPDGKISGSLAAAMDGVIEIVDEKASGCFDALLHRGRSYKLVTDLTTTAGIGTGGGLSLANFYGKTGSSELDHLTAFSLDLVVDMLQNRLRFGNVLGGLDADNPFSFDLPKIKLPKLETGSQRITSFPFTVGGKKIGGSDNTMSFAADTKKIDLDVSGLGGLGDASELLKKVGLGDLGNNLDISKLIGKLDVLQLESPPIERVLGGSGGGVTLESLSIAVEDDLWETKVEILDTVRRTGQALSAQIEDARASLAALVESEFDAFNSKFDNWTALSLQTEIEANLASRDNPVALFALPPGSPYFGQLDLAREITSQTIELFAATGARVESARRELSRGDQDLARKQYAKAYDHYRKAYKKAVGDDQDSDSEG